MVLFCSCRQLSLKNTVTCCVICLSGSSSRVSTSSVSAVRCWFRRLPITWSSWCCDCFTVCLMRLFTPVRRDTRRLLVHRSAAAAADDDAPVFVQESLCIKYLTSKYQFQYQWSKYQYKYQYFACQYSVSQKIPPEVLSQFFQNGQEFFVQILCAYCLFLSTLDHEFFIQLPATLTKLCHVAYITYAMYLVAKKCFTIISITNTIENISN